MRDYPLGRVAPIVLAACMAWSLSSAWAAQADEGADPAPPPAVSPDEPPAEPQADPEPPPTESPDAPPAEPPAEPEAPPTESPDEPPAEPEAPAPVPDRDEPAETEPGTVSPAVVSAGLTADILSQLTSAAPLYEPLPEWHVTPILRQLVDGGWNARGPLEADVKALGTRIAGSRRVKCYQVRFNSHMWGGKPVRIFAFYAHPASGGKFPGLLVVHGGGGYATMDRCLEAASRGYAALSIDLPGKGTLREDHSRSTGPDMTVKQIFTVKPTLRDNYLYNAVLAQMRSITFLCNRTEVDPGRIGLVGVSWGGATGLITTSLDKRVKCFVNMFGSGLLFDGSTWHTYFDKLPPREFAAWEDNFDASRYVAGIRVPVLGLTGTNDNCYYLHRFMRTMGAIQPTPDLCLRPNLDHKIDEPARSAYYKWLAVHLQGVSKGSPPRITGFRIGADDRGALVHVRAGGKVPVKRVEVCYGKTGDVGWTNRKWTTVSCSPDSAKSWWGASVPLPTQITYLFASVHFGDGSLLSTPVHAVGRAVVNGKPFALDVPFMYEGSFLVEAHAFAQLTGARVIEITTGDAPVVRIERNGVEAACSVQRRLGELCYVGLRDVAQRLNGTVILKNDRPHITMPPLKG